SHGAWCRIPTSAPGRATPGPGPASPSQECHARRNRVPGRRSPARQRPRGRCSDGQDEGRAMGLIHRGGIYLASAVIAKAVPLLMVPVLARLLPPQEFATASLFIAANSVVLALVGMNMQANIASNFYSAGREAIAVIVGNVLCVAGIVAMLGLGLAACVALVTEKVFSIPSPWFLPMPALAAAMLVSALNATLLRQQSRALAFAGFEIGLALASAASSLALVA